MRLTKEEKEYLKRILKEKAKKGIAENLQVLNISYNLLQSLEKKKLWEIKNFPQKLEHTKKELKKIFIKEKKIARGILNKISSQKGNRTSEVKE